MPLSPDKTQHWLRQKTLPYFKLYLAERESEDRRGAYIGMFAVAPILLIAIGLVLEVSRGRTGLIGPGLMLIPIALFLGALFVRDHYRKSSHFHIGKHLDVYSKRGTENIHRFLDATAQELLEAGAFFWLKIHTLLGTSQSNSRLGMIAQDAISASDAAMDELMVLCSNCIGEPVKKRGDDIKEAISGLAEGNFKGAMRDFAEVLNPDSPRYKVRSPHIDVVYRPARALAEKLQLLSSEIERLSSEAITAQQAMAGGGSQAIDGVLYAIQATRAAEAEFETSREQQNFGE